MSNRGQRGGRGNVLERTPTFFVHVLILSVVILSSAKVVVARPVHEVVARRNLRQVLDVRIYPALAFDCCSTGINRYFPV